MKSLCRIVAVCGLLAALSGGRASAQVTGTTSDVLSLPTLTIAGMNSSWACAVDQTNGSFRMTRTNLAAATLSTITLGPALSLTGTTSTPTLSNLGVWSLDVGTNDFFTQTNLTGTVSFAQKTNGTPQFGRIGIGTAATVTAAIFGKPLTVTSAGLVIQTTAGQTAAMASFLNSSGTTLLAIDVNGSLSITGSAGAAAANAPLTVYGGNGLVSAAIGSLHMGRSSSGVHYISPISLTGYTTGTSLPYGITFESGGFGIYTRVPSTRTLEFYVDSTSIAGVSSAGFFAQSGASNFIGSSLRLTNSASTASATDGSAATLQTLTGSITRTLPSATSGRLLVYYNAGVGTCTLTGGGALINGTNSQTLSSGSSAILWGDGTNFFGPIK